MKLTVMLALLAGAQSAENPSALKKIIDAMKADERGPTDSSNLTPDMPCFSDTDQNAAPCPSKQCSYIEASNDDYAWLCIDYPTDNLPLGSYKGLQFSVATSEKVNDRVLNPGPVEYLALRTKAREAGDAMKNKAKYAEIMRCPEIANGTWQMHEYHFNYVRHEEPSGALWWGQTELEDFPFNCGNSWWAGTIGSMHPKGNKSNFMPHSFLSLPCNGNQDCNGRFEGFNDQYNFQGPLYCAQGNPSELRSFQQNEYRTTDSQRSTTDTQRDLQQLQELRQAIDRMYTKSSGQCIDQKSCYAKLFGMTLKCNNAGNKRRLSESFATSFATALVASTATMVAAVAATI